MTHVFRNNTIERFLQGDYSFSGYDDIAVPNADEYIWWYQVPIKYDVAQLSNEVNSFAQKLLFVVNQIKDKQIVILTIEKWYAVNSNQSDLSLIEAISRFNSTARQLSLCKLNVKVLDITDFTCKYAVCDLIDWKFYFMSQMPLNPRLAKDFNEWFNKQLDSMALKRKKCLVLDLDNTLWGGVLGEDGVDGIKIGGDYPGKAFLYWQESLLELWKNGVILTLCTKNNENDVFELWNNNPFMVLKKEHFSSYRINWNDKASNIKEIAAELNIGLDSMVFVDDNPTERELIKQVLPMVAVPEWPAQPYELPKFYENLVDAYFKVYSITDEDKKKSEQYRQNACRVKAQAQFTNMEDFLRSLEICLTISKANEITIPRIAQMTQKTNQFNLTTKRYTENDIQKLIDDGALIYTLSVADRFGDNGITGCMILCKSEEGWSVDTLLLSCRILGKGIEFAFVKVVLKNIGNCTIESSYLPTEKNVQVKDFYEKIGLHLIKEINGNKYYKKDIKELNLNIKDYYKIIEQ